jgi:hypothetical protein
LLHVRNNKNLNGQVGCRRSWRHSHFQSEQQQIFQEGRLKVKMATEGRKHGQGKDHQQEKREEMDKELQDIRAELERLTFKVQQESRTRWVYEWPM